jgi:mannose/fructose/N-acetylgalactosamine-specific phosphotransferase system component IID
MRDKITKWNLFSVFWRLFYLQGSWNFEKMQNLGLAFILSPILKRLYPERERRIKAYQHYLSFFNTQPYMASFFIGLAIRLEERIAAGEMKEEEIEKMRKVLSSPLAVLGDLFFWESLRPFASLLAVMIILWVGQEEIGLLAFWLIFNLPHFYIRYLGLNKGYYLEKGVVGFIRKLNFPKIAYFIGAGSLFLAGIAVVMLAFNSPLVITTREKSWLLSGYLFFISFFSYLLKKVVSVNILALGLIILSFILGFFI